MPVSWSANRIDVVLRKGALGSLSGKYVYVFNASGSPVSTSGFPLAGGGTAPPPPVQPNPPTEVKTQ